MKSILPARFEKLMVATLLAAGLAGCSSTPDRIDELDQARSMVSAVQSSPDAGRYAADDVTAAHEALRRAEKLQQDKKSRREIVDAAYLAQRHAQVAEQQITRGRAEAATRDAEAERQRVVLQAREQEAAARQQEAAAREREAQAARTQAEQQAALLQEQLRELQARQTDRGLVLTLGDVLFDTGQSTLKPGAMTTIDRLATFLRDSPERGVTIEGHTDSVGDDAFNQRLSENRADSVKAALITRGIDAARVNALGKGESSPVAGNDNAAGRQQNRRVEIIISDPRVASGP